MMTAKRLPTRSSPEPRTGCAFCIQCPRISDLKLDGLIPTNLRNVRAK